MIIRRATGEDTVKLEEFFRFVRIKTFTERPPKEFQIGDYQKSTEEDIVWVVEMDHIIVGVLSIYIPNNFIHNLFIHPNFQRKGIGKQLLQLAEMNLAPGQMTLKIALDNLKVCEFYNKYGWQQLSIHEKVEKPYVLYVKDKNHFGF